MDRIPPFALRDCRYLGKARGGTGGRGLGCYQGCRSWKLSISTIAVASQGWYCQRLNADGTSSPLPFATAHCSPPTISHSRKLYDISGQFNSRGLHSGLGSRQVNIRRLPLRHRGTCCIKRSLAPGAVNLDCFVAVRVPWHFLSPKTKISARPLATTRSILRIDRKSAAHYSLKCSWPAQQRNLNAQEKTKGSRPHRMG
jgi:hypothetical protein